MSRKPKGHPKRKIITDHFIPVEKTKNHQTVTFSNAGTAQQLEAGESIHRKHAHMHTQPDCGLSAALTDELQRSFTWVHPLGATDESCADDEFLAGPESITEEALGSEFDKFERDMREGNGEQDRLDDSNLFTGDEPDVLGDSVIDWDELEKVNKDIPPIGFVEEIDHDGNASALLTSQGVASMY